MTNEERNDHERIVMRLLPRTTTCNPIAVKYNGGKPYSTGYYDTNIVPIKCCNKEPDLYGGNKNAGFFKEGVYEFRCSVCAKTGAEAITANGAAALWNKLVS